MAMTEKEKFELDLNGLFIREAILSKDEIAEISEQLRRITYDPKSLPPHERGIPGGPSSLLIDHPRVIDVLQEVISPLVRIDKVIPLWREKGWHGTSDVHGAGVLDPLINYWVGPDGKIRTPMMAVIFELTDIHHGDGATRFMPGSHKLNYPIPRGRESWDALEPYLRDYECPAGSAVFFTEALKHGGPIWQRPEPRKAILHTYANVALCWHRLAWIDQEILDGLPPHKAAYFREPWVMDLRGTKLRRPTVVNSVDYYVKQEREAPRSKGWLIDDDEEWWPEGS